MSNDSRGLFLCVWVRWVNRPSSDGPAETVSVRTYRSGASGDNRGQSPLKHGPLKGLRPLKHPRSCFALRKSYLTHSPFCPSSFCQTGARRQVLGTFKTPFNVRQGAISAVGAREGTVQRPGRLDRVRQFGESFFCLACTSRLSSLWLSAIWLRTGASHGAPVHY